MSIICVACQKDSDFITDEIDYQYHAHIQRPLPNQKAMGDTLSILISFESHTGRPVHHISIQIYDALTQKVIYDQPTVSAVNTEINKYDYDDTFILSTDRGVEANRDWVIEARVWGREKGAGEISQKLQFRVIP